GRGRAAPAAPWPPGVIPIGSLRLLHPPPLLPLVQGQHAPAVLAGEGLGLVLPGKGGQRGGGRPALAPGDEERAVGEDLETGRLIEDVRGGYRLVFLLGLTQGRE